MNYSNLKEIEKNRSEFNITIEKPAFDAEVMNVYRKNVKKLNVPGFRRGKAPKSIVEKMYGSSVFYDEALDNLLPDLYSSAIEESKLEVVSRPEIDVVSIDENGVLISCKVYTKPVAEVSLYKGLEAERAETVVTEEDIIAEIDQVRTRNARTLSVTDRAAEEGDEAIIDFEGFVDGVAFEGGKGEKYNLKLGSHSFIPGFEEQIVGKNIGDSFDIAVTFPDEYGAKELAGKESVFKTVLHELKKTELPELDDEFVKEVSDTFNTVDEYKTDVKAKITERKDKANDRAYEEKLIDALLAKTEVDIPAAMIESEVDSEIRDYEYRLRSQGGSIEMYYQYTGMDEKGLRDSMRPAAERQVKTRLALEAVVKAENITPTDEEIDAEYAKIAAGYAVELEKVKESIPADSISEDIVLRKAVDLIKENAAALAPEASESTAKTKKETSPAAEGVAAEKKTAAKKAAPKAKKEG